MSLAVSFAYRGPSRHVFLTIHVDTTGIIWDRGKINGPWQILLRSTERYHRAAYQWSQEPNLEPACLDHGHVKPCQAYVGPMLGFCWAMLGS